MYKTKRKGKKKWIWVLAVLILIASILAVLYFLLCRYKIRTVYVEGNIHYTAEEIQNYVMDGPLGDNSIFLASKYKKKGMDQIPFIDAVDVKILSPDTVRITVYEKALAGYVVYLGRYMYFDKDGTVVENSTVETPGIPEITGKEFDHIVVGQELPVEDPTVFNMILDVTQILGKYGLAAEQLSFDRDGKMTLIFGDIRVETGSEGLTNEKASVLKNLLPDLEGRKGVLKLTGSENIIFETEEENQ